jgi:hypothetical protein
MSIVGMVLAALVETKRRKTTSNFGWLDSTKPIPQYMFLGSADLSTFDGI